VYGLAFLIVPAVFFVHVGLLAAVIWAVAAHSRGEQSWARMPDSLHRWAWLAIEVVFGLINPVLYLAVLTPTILSRQSGAEWWIVPLQASAWILLASFWGVRVFGKALHLQAGVLSASVRGLLIAALACVALHSIKDTSLMIETTWGRVSAFTFVLMVLRLCPLYLIPAALLWDYIGSTSTLSGQAESRRFGLFLLQDRASRLAVAGVAGVALVTLAMAAYRRSDASVRDLVTAHRESIQAASARYGVDPRLVASIVYVIHREQLSPFRRALERLIVNAWARNLRREFGFNPPDNTGEGADQNPLLNRALDISVGLAQIKPRTAQTASVLATGQRPAELSKPVFFSYMDAEPTGEGWAQPDAVRAPVNAPLPVPAARHNVASALLDDRSNLAMCALILSLYQNQWEAANPEWSLRSRPDILATLYQIGFARSKPHGAPRSNEFGIRVAQVYEQPWLMQLKR
jgi:hypothetical protein